MILRLCLVFISLCLFFFFPPVSFASIDRSIEIEQLLSGLDNENSDIRIISAKYIEKLNINEKKLNEKLAELIRVGAMAEGDEKHLEEMLLFSRLLSSLDNGAYSDVFRGIVLMSPSLELREFALSTISSNHQPEPDQNMNSSQHINSALEQEQQSLINMLESDSVADKRRAAKMMTRMSFVHERVYEVAEQTLLSMAENYSREHNYVDTMSWLCRALGSSGDRRYAEAIISVIHSTGSSKIKKYAQIALREMPIKGIGGEIEYRLISEDSTGKKYEIFNSVTGYRWIFYAGSKTASADECRSICSEESLQMGMKYIVPSSHDFSKLYARFKKTDVMKIIGIKNYTTSDESDFPMSFSFKSGMTEDDVFAGHVACVSK